MIVTYSVGFVHGKQRPRHGRGRTFTPRITQENERRILDAYRGSSIRRHGFVAKAPQHVPVTFALSCTLPAPKRRPRWCPKALWDALQGVPFVRTPDIDNIMKEHMDALNGHAWHDDAQIVQTHAIKLPQRIGGKEVAHVCVFWEEDNDG